MPPHVDLLAHLVCIVALFILGRSVRDALFLERVHAEALPLMYGLTAGCVAGGTLLYQRISHNWSVPELARRWLLFSGALLFILWLWARGRPTDRLAFRILYVAIELVGTLAIVQFWTLATGRLNAQEARRVLAWLGMAGAITNVVAGFFLAFISRHIAAVDLILATAVLAWLPATWLRRRSSGPRGLAEPRTRDLVEATSEGPYLRWLLFTAGVGFAAITLVDFQFKIQASDRMADASALTHFFLSFFGYSGIVSVIVQASITPWLLRHAKTATAISVLPFGLLVAGLAALALPSVWLLGALTAMKGLEVVLRYSVHDTTQQMLYVPLGDAHRRSFKAWVDGALKPACIGTVGMILFTMERSFGRTPPRHIAALTILLLLAWLWGNRKIHRRYVAALIARLPQHRTLRPQTRPLARGNDSLAVIRRSLEDGDSARAGAALSLLRDLRSLTTEDLERALRRDDEALSRLCVELLEGDPKLWRPSLFERLLGAPSPDLRRAALLAVPARPPWLALAQPAEKDPDPAVRTAALALGLHGDQEKAARHALQQSLTEGDATTRVAAAYALATRRRGRDFPAALLEAEAPDVRRIGLLYLPKAVGSGAVSVLTAHLNDRPVAPAAEQALQALGARAEAGTIDALRAPQTLTTLDAKVRAIRVLGAIGGADARTCLVHRSPLAPGRIAEQTAQSLHRIARRTRPLRHRDCLEGLRRLRTRVNALDQHLKALGHTPLRGTEPLLDALRHDRKRHQSAAIWLVRARFAGGPLDRPPPDNRLESFRIEALHNEGSPELATLTGHILQATPPARATAAAPSPGALLPALAGDPNPWIRACAVHALTAHESFEPAVEAVADEDEIVVETALIGLAKHAERLAPDLRARIIALWTRTSAHRSAPTRAAWNALAPDLSSDSPGA